MIILLTPGHAGFPAPSLWAGDYRLVLRELPFTQLLPIVLEPGNSAVPQGRLTPAVWWVITSPRSSRAEAEKHLAPIFMTPCLIKDPGKQPDAFPTKGSA